MMALVSPISALVWTVLVTLVLGVALPEKTRRVPPPGINLASLTANYQITPDCPKGDGFYPDDEYCYKYFECVDGEKTDYQCGEGLVYDVKLSHGFNEPCNIPQGINCAGKKFLEEVKPVKDLTQCPRAHGSFALEDDCTKFMVCVGGKPFIKECDTGLVYHEDKGTCVQAYIADREKCEKLFQFDCNNFGKLIEERGPIMNLPNPQDCRTFFTCKLGSAHGTMQTCPLGQLFDLERDQCRKIRRSDTREGCRDYYIRVKKSDVPSGYLAELTVAGYDKDPYYKNYVYIPRNHTYKYDWLALN